LEGKTGKDGRKLEGLLEYFDVGGSPKELMAYMVKSQSNYNDPVPEAEN
jgi:sterol 3beta-glucosyltransferase